MFYNQYMNNIICSNSFLDASIFDCNRAWSKKKSVCLTVGKYVTVWFFKRMGIAKLLIWIIMSWNQKLNHLYSICDMFFILQYSRLMTLSKLYHRYIWLYFNISPSMALKVCSNCIYATICLFDFINGWSSNRILNAVPFSH